MKTKQVKINEEIHTELKILCAKEKKKVQDLTNEILDYGIKKYREEISRSKENQ